ncbi:nucleolar protein 11-like [Clarias gariepinus]|uniref:nucleolar protein 11-like n=1 Tax=Clarias gariepinus TaxID=13013 RepID=UPI00234DFB03|nr:nucleolar protein 11-like [Clarias gariepinus]
MAALYEAYTLCGLVLTQNSAHSGIQGIEPDGDADRVIVTDCARSVTVYKVSDQKPLGSWAVKQGQRLSCPAVYNTQTNEYVVVTDEKVIRVWKDDELSLDKAFKATVSAEIYRVHSAPEQEPVVLFRCGAVRQLDSLLAAPQQHVEEVLSQEEVIRWSNAVQANQRLILLFSTEQKGEHFLYVQRFNPNTLSKHRLEMEPGESAPLSYTATYRDGNIHLLYLLRSGGVYESILVAQPVVSSPDEEIHPLPRSLLLQLPAGDDELSCASLLPLNQAYLAVLGVPHPSARTGKDFLCLWNTHFQTLQAARELPGKIYGQMWCYSSKLFVCHGKTLSVIPFECEKSSLANAMGKLRQTSANEGKGPAIVPSWNDLLHGSTTQTHMQSKTRSLSTRRTKTSSKCQQCPTVEQMTENIKTSDVQEVERQVQEFLSGTEQEALQLSAGRLACELVARGQEEPEFYPHTALLQLVDTHYLCHSVCPDLLMLALEKSDFRLCQLCLQLFPDIPEAVTCACLKTILSIPDTELEHMDLEADSLLFMKALAQSPDSSADQPNGFCPPPADEESCDVPSETLALSSKPCRDPLTLDMSCPVGINKGALLNEVLQTPYSDSLLLPHLKDLSVSQVILLLQYLRFLYLKYSQDAHSRIRTLRMPAINQILDWVCLLLDAHFTVLVLAPEAKSLLSGLHKFVRSQVKLYSELGKIEGSLEALKQSKQSQEMGQYSIEVLELF